MRARTTLATALLALLAGAVALGGCGGTTGGRAACVPGRTVHLQGGLWYVDERCGRGAVAERDDVVVVDYVGRLTSGKIFDSSARHGGPIVARLGTGQLIAGWDAGLVGMAVGGVRRLEIPAPSAFGPGGYPGAVPPGTPVHFTVRLVAVHRARPANLRSSTTR